MDGPGSCQVGCTGYGVHCTESSTVRTLKLRIKGTGPDAGTSQDSFGRVTPDGEAESCCCWVWTGSKLRLMQAHQEQDDKDGLADGLTSCPRIRLAHYMHRQPALQQHSRERSVG